MTTKMGRPREIANPVDMSFTVDQADKDYILDRVKTLQANFGLRPSQSATLRIILAEHKALKALFEASEQEKTQPVCTATM